jgi:hypothetical protein
MCWTATDLSTLIEGKKYWVNNGHWAFKCLKHTPNGIQIYIYHTKKSPVVPYGTFLDVQLSS